MKNSGKALWIVLLVLVGFLWFGFKIADLFMDHRRIEEATGELIERAFTPASHGIENEISKIARSHGVDVDPIDIKLEMALSNDKVTVDFDYRRIVDFLLIQRGYPFHVHAERYPRRGSGAGSTGDAVERSIEKSRQNSSGRMSEAFQNP